jgi:cell division transport system permease protein
VSRSLTAISLTVLALVLTAAMAIMVFATRAGLMTHAGIVEILHLTGAQGEFIAAEFERHFSRLGLRAGMVGLALALLTLLIVYLATSTGADPNGLALVPRLSVSPLALFGLLLVPLVAAIVATITARLTVLRALETMP